MFQICAQAMRSLWIHLESYILHWQEYIWNAIVDSSELPVWECVVDVLAYTDVYKRQVHAVCKAAINYVLVFFSSAEV